MHETNPQVGEPWRVDELYLKFKGKVKCFCAMTDGETRYWIAKEVAGDKLSREAVDCASHPTRGHAHNDTKLRLLWVLYIHNVL